MDRIARPAARTRLTEATPGLGEIIRAPDDPGRFDIWDPANVSPLVGWLASEDCPANGRIFYVQGGAVKLMTGWAMAEGVERDDRWTIDELDKQLRPLVG